MKKILAVSAAAMSLALLSAPANAANFVGSYWGIDVGYGAGQANSEHWGFTPALLNTQTDADIDGAILGAHIGQNWAGGSNWVWGLEAEVRYQGMDGDDGGSGGAVNELSTNWEGSLQAHVGVTSGNSMMYVLAGWSWLDADSNDLTSGVTVSDTYSGWTAGVGIEFGLSDDANLRVQYRYSDYGSETLAFPIYFMETGPAIHDVTVGLNLRF